MKLPNWRRARWIDRIGHMAHKRFGIVTLGVFILAGGCGASLRGGGADTSRLPSAKARLGTGDIRHAGPQVTHAASQMQTHRGSVQVLAREIDRAQAVYEKDVYRPWSKRRLGRNAIGALRASRRLAIGAREARADSHLLQLGITLAAISGRLRALGQQLRAGHVSRLAVIDAHLALNSLEQQTIALSKPPASAQRRG